MAEATENVSYLEDDELSEDSSDSDSEDDEVSEAGEVSLALGDLSLSLVPQKASSPLDASLRSDTRGPEVSSDALATASDTQQPPYRKQPPSSNAEREKAVNSLHNFVSAEKEERQARNSGTLSRSTSREGSSARRMPSPPRLPYLSLDQVAEKVPFILEQFVKNCNYQESALSVSKTFQPFNMGDFVAVMLDIVLKCSAPIHSYVGTLLGHLMKEGILTTEHFLEGFEEIAEVADDLATDVPKVWLYLAQILVPMLSMEALSFSDLKTATTGLHNLVIKVLRLLVKEKGRGWISQRWYEAGMSWADFAPADSIERIVKENKLEFTVDDAAVLSAEAIHAKLRPEQGAPATTDEQTKWISQPVAKSGRKKGKAKSGAKKTDVKLHKTEKARKPAQSRGSQAEQDKTAQPVTKSGRKQGKVKSGAKKTDVKLHEAENVRKPAKLCGSQAEQDKTAKQVTQSGRKHGKTKSRVKKTHVKLHEAENPWKPARLRGSQAEQDKTADLYKEVRGVLNKLTPQKFDMLVQQVQTLPIDNSERLHGVIDLVFEKAADDPRYSVAYAQMCKVLSDMQVADGSKEGQPENFGELLLSRCQHEFEKNTQADLKRDDRFKVIEQCTDPEKKKELQLEIEETERRLRMKAVGKIRFVGELFKFGVVTSNIMHRCIQHLLKQRDEESLECLCKLLTTAGKDLESKKHDLSKYFEEMKALSKQRGQISSRVRFMLQDVIELRDNKWVPRRDDSAPKTIDQINSEAEWEAMLKMKMPSGGGGGSRGGGGRRDNPGGYRRRRGGPSEDGRQFVRRKNLDTSKLRIEPPDVMNVSLGGSNQFAACTQGAGHDLDTDCSSSLPQTSDTFAVPQDVKDRKSGVAMFRRM